MDAFTSRLIELMSDLNLRKKMGAAAKENSDKYSEEKVMKQWLLLFETLLAK